MSEEPGWTDAEFCPYCGEQTLEDNGEWDTDDGCFLSYEVCESCGGEFQTISDQEFEPEEEHTLQFVPEMEDGDVVGVQVVAKIRAGEDDVGTQAERARLNMRYGGAAELQGPPYAVEQLYEYIEHMSDLPVSDVGKAGTWLLEDEDE